MVADGKRSRLPLRLALLDNDPHVDDSGVYRDGGDDDALRLIRSRQRVGALHEVELARGVVARIRGRSV
jgi:hypothetical protein